MNNNNEKPTQGNDKPKAIEPPPKAIEAPPPKEQPQGNVEAKPTEKKPLSKDQSSQVYTRTKGLENKPTRLSKPATLAVPPDPLLAKEKPQLIGPDVSCGKCKNPNCHAQCLNVKDDESYHENCVREKCKENKGLAFKQPESSLAKEKETPADVKEDPSAVTANNPVTPCTVEPVDAKENPSPVIPKITVTPPPDTKENPSPVIDINPVTPSTLQPMSANEIRSECPLGMGIVECPTSTPSPPSASPPPTAADKVVPKIDGQTQTVISFRGVCKAADLENRPLTSRHVAKGINDIITSNNKTNSDVVVTAISWTSPTELIVNVMDSVTGSLLGSFEVKEWTFTSAYKEGLLEEFETHFLIHYLLDKVKTCKSCVG